MLMSWGRRKGNLFEFDSIRDELRRKFESFHWSRRLLIDIGLPDLEDSPISISLRHWSFTKSAIKQPLDFVASESGAGAKELIVYSV